MEPIRHDHLEQGSDAWHAFRRQYLTASVAAIVMGCAPSYWQLKTAHQLRQYREGTFTPPPISGFVQDMLNKGHEYEALAVEAANLEDSEFEPAVYSRFIYAASLDAVCLKTGAWMEVKKPKDKRSKVWKLANGKGPVWDRIPQHYWWQLVHQAYVLPGSVSTCHFVVFLDGEPPVTIEISRNRLLQDWWALEAAWEKFLDPDDANESQSDDERLALDYIRLDAEFALAKEKFERAKTALLFDGPRIIPGLIEISTTDVKGRIDYKAAASSVFSSKELESYRNVPTERTSIKVIKED